MIKKQSTTKSTKISNQCNEANSNDWKIIVGRENVKIVVITTVLIVIFIEIQSKWTKI